MNAILRWVTRRSKHSSGSYAELDIHWLEPMDDTGTGNFTSRFVLVYVSRDDEDGYFTELVEQPRFDVRGDRLFLIGQVPSGATPGDWSGGLTLGVAWDKVEKYYEFATLDEYEQKVSQYPEESGLLARLKRKWL